MDVLINIFATWPMTTLYQLEVSVGKAQLKNPVKGDDSLEIEDMEVDLSSGSTENKDSSLDSQLDLFEADLSSEATSDVADPLIDQDNEPDLSLEDEPSPSMEDGDQADLSEFKTEIEPLHGSSEKKDREEDDAVSVADLEEIGSADDMDIDDFDLSDDDMDSLNLDDIDSVAEDAEKPADTVFKQSAFDELGIQAEESTVMVDPLELDEAEDDQNQASDDMVAPPPPPKANQEKKEAPQKELPVGATVFWEELVTLKEAPKGSVAQLLTQDFDSDIQKHVSLQAVAMLNGEYSVLNDWKHCVWRNAAARTYPHDGRKRLPKSIIDPILKTDLRSLIVNLSPLFAQVYIENFSLQGLAKRQNVKLDAIQKRISPLEWNSTVLAQFGFLRYAHRFNERRYKAFNMTGLGSEIFFEGKTRSFYFDVSYYQQKPLGRLFYGILTKIWALRLGYFGFVSLDITKDVFPCIAKFKEYFAPKTMFSTLNFSKDVYKQFYDSSLGDKAKLYEATLFGFKSEQLFSLQNAMNDHIYKLLVADTLDLVGITEYITQEDVLELGPEANLKALQKKSIYIKSLFKVFTELDL